MDEMKLRHGRRRPACWARCAPIAELKPKLNVIGLIPTCENMPSSTAVKPGDVVTSMSGQTIEILNTDARRPAHPVRCAHLCRALQARTGDRRRHADRRLRGGARPPQLGPVHRDDALAEQLLAASREALDPLWRMPLDEEYDEVLKTNFADMANVGPRPGGAITAAMFLRRFTGKYRWRISDIAGTAWKSGSARAPPGARCRCLTQFLLSQAQAA
jgi:leucyl aminopeptidase